jgi:two-component system, NtrC family, sensor kinase
MKIEQKIVTSNIVNVGLMMLIGFFAVQSLNVVLTKLRFVEIADDLNASFLEMRLSEKNYFLYNDQSALTEIQDKLQTAKSTVESASKDISRAVGDENLVKLKTYIDNYYRAVSESIVTCDNKNRRCETKLRAEGKKLREFSESMVHLERVRVGNILYSTKQIMLFSVIGIILSAIALSHFVSQKILRSLRKIEALANSIASGNYEKIDGVETNDELGSVIKAVNSMSEELKTHEEELLQSKKLASMGILTAGVAHEITNPLNNISMIAQTYAEVYDSMGRQDRIEFMKKVESEADRIKKIVRNLLDFSKPKMAVFGDADIKDVIRTSLNLVQNMLDINKIEVHANLKNKLPHVMVDQHQIQQVLVNLMVNASQAMPDGGWLNVGAKHNKKKDMIEICVTDTGLGISPEFLPHVFDPFFSTKGVGGTGLGLSVSYGIIKNHSGNIKVDSALGTGTTFSIELPVSKMVE